MPTFISPARRGLAVQRILPLLPAEVLQDVAAFLHDLSRSSRPPNLMRDLDALLQRPALHQWVASQDHDQSECQAALVACFMRMVCQRRDRLMAHYVRRLVREIRKIVRGAAATIRLTHDPEFRAALAPSCAFSAALSQFGPLAVFFVQSIARAEWAWDALVDAASIPRHVQAFGWLPREDGLYPTLRFLLTAQCPGRFHPHALLYSPLARYLVDQGLAQRVHVVQMSCPRCGYWGTVQACPSCGLPLRADKRRWLLATAFVERSTFVRLSRGRQALLLEDRPAFARPRDNPTPAERTTHPEQDPGEQASRRAMKDLALRAVRHLLDALRDPGRPHLRCLVLWAEAARLEDPGLLLSPRGQDEDVAQALIEALIAPEVSGRAQRLPRMNRWIHELAPRVNPHDDIPLTGTQMASGLARLRRKFMNALSALAREQFWD